MNLRNSVPHDLVDNYYTLRQESDNIFKRNIRKNWLEQLQADEALILHHQALERLNEIITNLEINRAFHAQAARTLHEKFKTTIECRFQKYKFSKIDDYDLAEAMRKTYVLLTTPVSSPNQAVSPIYLAAHADFTDAMYDMKMNGRLSAIGTAGLALAVAAAIAVAVVLNLASFGILGATAITAAIIALNVSAAVTQLAIGAHAAFRAFGQFNIARHALGMGSKMDKLAQETQAPRKH